MVRNLTDGYYIVHRETGRSVQWWPTAEGAETARERYLNPDRFRVEAARECTKTVRAR